MSKFLVRVSLCTSLALSSACIATILLGEEHHQPSFVVLLTLWLAISVAGVAAEKVREK